MEDENKQEIADKLCETLKLTRQYHDIDRIRITEAITTTESGTYIDEYAEVYIKHNDVPYKRIDITADSGTAMIHDIMKRL